MSDEPIAGVLLAAGGGSRFGADKLAATLHGETLLQGSAAAMLHAGLAPVLAVVQPGCTRAIPDRVTAVVNDRWSSGMASSVQAGLAALRGDARLSAAVVAPADQPRCGPAVYLRLVEAFRRTGRSVIVAAFDGAIRNPVLLGRAEWGLAERIEGDVGLSGIVRSLAPMAVECADIGSVEDVDTPADLAQFRLSAAPTRGTRGDDR